MTEHLLDTIEIERSFRRIRIRKRINHGLLGLLTLLTLCNVAFLLYTISWIDEISNPAPFAHWKALYVLLGTVLLLIPVFSLLVAFLVALIPIKGLTYAQRTFTAFLVFCVVIEGIGLYQLLVDYFSVPR